MRGKRAWTNVNEALLYQWLGDGAEPPRSSTERLARPCGRGTGRTDINGMNKKMDAELRPKNGKHA